MSEIAKAMRYFKLACAALESHFGGATSEAKKEASRKNGAKGGRPTPPKKSPVSETLRLEVQLFEGISGVKLKTQELWVKTYEDKGWIQTEINKANVWISSNPQKAPKSQFARFYSGWLSRAWEQHRKGLPGQSKGPKSYNERMLDKYQEWYGD